MSDLTLLTMALQRDLHEDFIEEDYGWHNSALDVLDCVLSLNRRYKSFVLPRVYAFQSNHPEIADLNRLKVYIDRYARPIEFLINELNYNDQDRAQILVGVIDYLIRVQIDYAGKDELEKLKNWAISAKPQDSLFVGIKGFGLAGFQYLRMLFGAQTSKPDRHIKRYVSDVIGRNVNEIEALDLLEQAAKKVGLPVRQVDHSIWEKRSQGDL